MLHLSFSINWLAVLLASIALQALGAAWFMVLAPKPYALALGRTDLAQQKPAPIFIVGPLLCGVVVTLSNAVLMGSLGVSSFSGALLFGAVVGAGYLVPTVVNVAINPNIPRPLLYGLVNGPYFLLSSLISCAILFAMH